MIKIEYEDIIFELEEDKRMVTICIWDGKNWIRVEVDGNVLKQVVTIYDLY